MCSRIRRTTAADQPDRRCRHDRAEDPAGQVGQPLGLTYDPENRPEAANLLNIYAALADLPRAEVEARFAGSAFSAFKGELADLAVEKLAPIAAEMRRLMADPADIDRLLRRGAERAEAIASDNLARVYDLVGFLPR